MVVDEVHIMIRMEGMEGVAEELPEQIQVLVIRGVRGHRDTQEVPPQLALTGLHMAEEVEVA